VAENGERNDQDEIGSDRSRTVSTAMVNWWVVVSAESCRG